ncbi:hypothetical protein ABIE18_004392 [Arthrobacter sp. 2762]
MAGQLMPQHIGHVIDAVRVYLETSGTDLYGLTA